MSKITPHNQKQLVAFARRSWLFVLAGVFVVLLAVPLTTITAAPPNQTVPIPTPEDTPEPVPTATPTSRPDDGDDDDDDDDSSSEPATPTPAPDAEVLTAVVIADQLNVRGGPSVEYAAVGKVVVDDVLTVIGRNEAGDWWYICCSTDTGVEGWVSAQFLTPGFSDEQADALPIIPVDGPPPTPEPVADPETVTETEPSVSVDETEAMATTEGAAPTFALALNMAQSPSFAWQGQEIDLQYVITNPGNEDALNVELRNELPAPLSYVDSAGSDGGKSTDLVLANGSTVFGITWPSLAAGQRVTGTVTLLITADAPHGAVIQNIAVAGADNAQPASAGINIGMPPAILPDFR